jgi:hypothetical protein
MFFQPIIGGSLKLKMFHFYVWILRDIFYWLSAILSCGESKGPQKILIWVLSFQQRGVSKNEDNFRVFFYQKKFYQRHAWKFCISYSILRGPDADSTFWSKIHTVHFLEEENIFSFYSSLSEQIFLPKLHHSENDVVQTRTREKGRGVIDLRTAWRDTETVFEKILRSPGIDLKEFRRQPM